MPQLLDLADEAALDLLEFEELLVGPVRLLGALEHALLPGLADLVADRRGALEADPLTPLVDVEGVAALEARVTGELGVGHLVVERHAVADQMVPGLDAGAEEPPLVPAEDQVGIRDAPHLGGGCPVAGVAGYGERLRGNDAPETALLRPPLVVVQGVRVVHALHPAADVVDRHRLLQLSGLHGHAHVPVEVGRVEAGGRLGGVSAHGSLLSVMSSVSALPSGRAPARPARRRAPCCRCRSSGSPPRRRTAPAWAPCTTPGGRPGRSGSRPRWPRRRP